MHFLFCSCEFWSPKLKTMVSIRNQMNFIKACNLNCLPSNSLKKVKRSWCKKCVHTHTDTDRHTHTHREREREKERERERKRERERRKE